MRTEPFTKEEILTMWPQAAGELRGFQRHLERTGAGLTAAQIGMALQLAGVQFENLREPECNGTLVHSEFSACPKHPGR